MHDENAFENGWLFFNLYLRGGRYAGCILNKKATKKNAYCRYLFYGYDFRHKTTKFDWFLVWAAVSQLGLFFALSALRLVVTKFF